MDENQLKKNKNDCQFILNNKKGHYESYFLRANHPTRALAFWLRYTIFSPKSCPEKAIGELWFAYFDGEQHNVIAEKNEFPLSACIFNKKALSISIGNAKLSVNTHPNGDLKGYSVGELNSSKKSAHTTNQDRYNINWQLNYDADKKPLLFLPEKLYQTTFPKAKSYIGNPNTLFNGEINITINEQSKKTINITDWQGSENHNWGCKHTDEYAWGQVAGFDNNKNAFLECITARVKVGPILTPKMTLICLRVDDKEYSFNTIIQSLKAKGDYHYFQWNFESTQNGITIKGEILANKEHFVGLNYYNPPGGSNSCLNSKIAQCSITIKEKGKNDIILFTKHRAAFEILTADKNHKIEISC